MFFWLAMMLACAPVARAQSGIVSNTPPSQVPHFTLPQCIDLALKQSPDILVAKKRLEEAAGSIVEARAGYLPSLTTSSTYEWIQLNRGKLNLVTLTTNPSLGTNDVVAKRQTWRDEIWNVDVRLTETIFAGGAIRGRMDIARLQKQSRTLEYQAAVDQAIMDTRVAFYEILRNQSDVAVHQQAVGFLTGQTKNERDRLEVGTGQKLNVLRAEVNLALEQSALVDSRNRLRNSYLRLSELLAIPYSVDQDRVPFDIEGELTYEKVDLDLSDCLSHALTHRPELVVHEDEVKIQKQQLVVDRSDLFPRLDLFGAYDLISQPDRSATADYYKGYVAGAEVSWHVFDGFAAQGHMRSTRARIAAAEISLDAMHRTIEAEVVRACRDLQKAEENIQTQTANVQLATESLKLATGNFSVGLTSQLELLQSQLDLTRAQTAELSARFDYNTALAELQRAMGSDFHMTDARRKDRDAQ